MSDGLSICGNFQTPWNLAEGTVNGLLSDNGQFLINANGTGPGDSGGPVLNAEGQLVGLVLGNYKNDPTLTVAQGLEVMNLVAKL